jgi:hypothetical protein
VNRTKISSIETTRFTEFFIRANGLGKTGFDEWVFAPGMRRDAPHEGLDVCLYRDRQSKIHYLDRTTQIPAMYAGVVVKIFGDFLGKSVIMEHALPDKEDITLFTIFGHTQPAAGLEAGSSFHQGDIIASIAGPGRPKAGITRHLHISIGFPSKMISYDSLNWESIGKPDVVSLSDPLSAINGKYSLLEPHRLIRPEQ